jgi:hypothetical protein
MSSPARLHYHHSLDTPLPVRAADGVVRLKGWCFAAGGDARPQLQLRIGQLTLATTAGSDRADVSAAFPAIPHALHSGFEITGHVPAGLSVAELWAGREGFGWQMLVSFSVYAEAAVLHGAIDLPAEKEITANCSLDGWCFHPQREIAELWLHYGTRSVRCRHYGHERADVAGQFPHLPQARLSGFSSEDVLKPGEGRVRLRAVDRDGGVYFCETDRFIRLQPAVSVHQGGDPRLDGRALFRAFSGRQSALPSLRVIVPAGHPRAAGDVQRIAQALKALPGEKWRIIAVTGAGAPSADLRALAAVTPRLTLANQAAPDAASWDLRISPGETPDIHGLMAALLATADHPELQAIYGDFSSGEKHEIHRQPPWSRDLALAGGIDPLSPVLLAGSLSLDPVASPLIALAIARVPTAHVSAALTHRPDAPAADLSSQLPTLANAYPSAQPILSASPERIRYEPGKKFHRPQITAIVAGDEKDLPALRKAFPGEIDEWLTAGPDSSPSAQDGAIQKATGEFLVFLYPDMRPVSEKPITQLALFLAGSPGTAVMPLLLQPNLAPWTETDLLAARTRRTLQAFDPSFAPWTNRALALFTRQVPYLTQAGLMIARSRLQELGGLDLNFESPTGALLDLSFRLRAAGTPPLLCADARVIAQPGANAMSSFAEALLLDRWDTDDANPLRIQPLVQAEVLA